MTTQLDFGQIMRGRGEKPQASTLNGQFLQRTSVWLTQETAVGSNFQIKIGAGGMFWYSLPEAKAGEPGAHKLLPKFGPGISQAQAVYRFGDGEAGEPTPSLRFGLFPYKYNGDAQNLGEYLLRSGTYPGTLTTGGWNLLSSAEYLVQGLQFHLPLLGGRLRSDFLLPMERDLPPMYDLSPTWVGSLMVAPGLEFGAGISWNHGISVRPSLTSPRNDTGFVLFKNPGNAYFVQIANPDTAIYGSNPFILVRDTTQFYTFKGIKLMARMSFDPKAFIGKGPFGPRDLNIYAEAALLGVKDYPVLYEKPLERLPVMVGFNIPTFNLFDVFAFEIEHYGSKFTNSLYQPYNNRMPIPDLSTDLKSVAVITDYNPDDPKFKDDDWKWSFYATKQVLSGIRLYGQVASDHMRPNEYSLNPFWTPVTQTAKDWYYLARLEFAI